LAFIHHGGTAQLLAATNGGWKDSFVEPAKRAERVLAPGEGEAEPGVDGRQFKEPAKLATDSNRSVKRSWVRSVFFKILSIAHFVGSDPVWLRFPEARLRHRLGLALSPPASQAGWLIPLNQAIHESGCRFCSWSLDI